MFGIGAPELIVICLVALIFIGPKRLPEVARTVGRGYKELQRAFSGIQNEFESAEDAVKKEAGKSFGGSLEEKPSSVDKVKEKQKKV